jgi:hypothetical protein
VAVAELSTYRLTHEFQLPCCLCGVMKGTPSDYYETKVFVQFYEEFYFGCAYNFCGYKGVLIHSTADLLLWEFNGNTLVTTTHISKYAGICEFEYPRKSFAEPRGKSYYHYDMASLNTFRTTAMTVGHGVSAPFTDLFERLAKGSGVRKEVYDMMFVQCRRCDLIYTLEGFHKHTCQLQLACYRNPLYSQKRQEGELIESTSEMVVDK